jgi:hypothetical protein
VTPGRAAAGIGCLVLFLLPFAGIGLFAAVQVVRFAAAGDWKQAGFFVIFALVFGGVGVGGIIGALVGRRVVAERAALEARHPDAPWLWRADWAAGRIEDGGRQAMWAGWAFAGFWNLVSLPAAWFGTQAALTGGKPAALVALLFPLVGIGLLVWAVRATLRYRRYGVSVLELSQVPGVVGRAISGAVRTTSPVHPPDGFQVRLVCSRRVVRGGGKNRSTSETVLWEEERRVQAQADKTGRGTTTSIPFAFPIPPDASPSNAANPRDVVLWRLRVGAAVPGVDYEATFEVPVFRTAASDLPPGDGDAVPAVEPPVPADYRQPPESRIQVTTNRRGTEILFPAARNPGVAAGATLFLLIWGGATGFMLSAGAPGFLIVVFALFGLLILWGVLELWLRVTRVTADAGTVVLSSGYLLPARERRLPMSEIADVKAKIGMQAGGAPYYDLVLVGTDGRSVTAGHALRDKREAEWLAATLKQALARR